MRRPRPAWCRPNRCADAGGALGFANLVTWTRGVDRSLFRPQPKVDLADLPGPIFLTVSRVAPEKNIEAFLDLDLPGSKLVVGDGPMLPELRRRYPGVHFAGSQTGEALRRYYASADVFVFPSLTDTFGIVLIEALACGVAGRGLSRARTAGRRRQYEGRLHLRAICARRALRALTLDRADAAGALDGRTAGTPAPTSSSSAAEVFSIMQPEACNIAA